MTKDQSSYRQIVKATSLFGGVQVYQIFISVIRAKFIAVLLGPTGMGIAGLLNATIGLVESITNFGLRTSAVKNVAADNQTGDFTRVSKTIKVLRRLVWITGGLGMLTTIVLSPWLSELTFGNKDYTFAFVWVSVSLLLRQISSGQLVVLQGLRKLKHIAKANVFGSTFGLIITIPLYYWLGIEGIVPAIIITACITLFASWYFSRKVKTEEVELSTKETITEGKGMLTMGFMISFAGIYKTVRYYIIKIFISNIGGVAQVGLYTAGLAIINTYVGMVFSAMSTDYYPRLSAVAHDNTEARKLINQQAIIAVLLLGPILGVFIVFVNWMLLLLYTERFLEIGLMIQWAALGMLFRASSWPIAYVFLAKGNSKLFFTNEFVAGLFSFSIYLLSYYVGGLTGIGFAFLIHYFYYTLQVYFIAKHKYKFSYSAEFAGIFLKTLILLATIFIVSLFLETPWVYVIGTFLIIASTVFSYKELDERIGVKNLIAGLMRKKPRK